MSENKTLKDEKLAKVSGGNESPTTAEQFEKNIMRLIEMGDDVAARQVFNGPEAQSKLSSAQKDALTLAFWKKFGYNIAK